MKRRFILIVFLVLLSLIFGGCVNQQIEHEKIVQIACGNDFSLFLYDSGKVRAIGKNNSGQLGVGDTKNRYELTDVLLPEAVSKIGASDDSAYALTKDNVLYTWGDNRYRQAKNSDEPAITIPVKFEITGKNGKEEIVQVALGWLGSYALTKSGNLYGWGNKLALMMLEEEDLSYDPIYRAVPLLQNNASKPQRFRVVGGKEGDLYKPENISMIAIGSGTIMGLGGNGTFYGIVGPNGTGAVPYKQGEIILMAAGRSFSILLTKEGSLYLWGNNSHGELGSGDYKAQRVPQFRSFAEDPIENIAVGPSHILVLTLSGKVLAWGDNTNHQLGLVNEGDVLSPTHVDFPEKITSIATGFHHSYAIGESGKLYAFGSNDYGQLMTGDQTARDIPTVADMQSVVANPAPVIVPDFNQEIVTAKTMDAFLTESGKVFTKGSGEMGTLGTETSDNHTEPTYVPLPDTITQIEAGVFDYTVLTSKGEVYNWGSSELNSLGHGEDKWYPTYTKVLLPEKITKIRSRRFNTAALSESGNWYMWGDNTYGGLATGDMEYKSGPVKIKTPVPFTEISPSRSYWLALTEKGEVYQWGTWKTKFTEEMYVPDIQLKDLKYQKITLPEKIIKVKPATYNNYALSETGNLYVWGLKFSQKPEVFLKNVKDFVVSPREEDFMALTQDGKVYYWGSNLKNPYSPVEIKYPEKMQAIFPGEGIFYAAGQEYLYTANSTWIQEGMQTKEFPQKTNYRYKK
jgi:alpha-tubulin suppressor-like RCC1 family protein